MKPNGAGLTTTSAECQLATSRDVGLKSLKCFLTFVLACMPEAAPGRDSLPAEEIRAHALQLCLDTNYERAGKYAAGSLKDESFHTLRYVLWNHDRSAQRKLDSFVKATTSNYYLGRVPLKKDDFLGSGPDSERWFIHEMAHVWQYQLGYPVMLEGAALHATEALRGTNPYRYTLAPGRRICAFNMEQQANILADYHSLAVHGDAARIWLYGVQYRETPNILQLLEYTLADFFLTPRGVGNLPPIAQ